MPSVAEAAAAIVAAKMLGPISESMKFESKLLLIKLRVKFVRNFRCVARSGVGQRAKCDAVSPIPQREAADTVGTEGCEVCLYEPNS